MKKNPKVNIELVDWQDKKDMLRKIREEVFIIGQNVPQNLEWDEFDETSKHLLAENAKGEAVGTARMHYSEDHRQAKIGRVAVLAKHRKKGIGQALVEKLIEVAKQDAVSEIILGSQVDATAFYNKMGFVEFGGEYLEAGIRHRKMILRL
jgi:predicted GNAT family N-acyltransferase